METEKNLVNKEGFLKNNKNLKLIIILETILILILIIIILYISIIPNIIPSTLNENIYCSKHYYDDKICLLSPKVYTKITPAEDYLILNLKPLQQNITDYINTQKTNNISVYILNLRDSSSFGINSNQKYLAFSLNKLPVAILTLKKVEEGKLSLDTILPIESEDKDSAFGTLYSKNVTQLSIRELLRLMLSESDNTALNVLSKESTLEELHNLSVYLNYYTDDVPSITDSTQNSYEITAKTTSNLFSSLYLSTILKPEDSKLILSDLANNSFDIKKYANISDNVTISQKYGEYYSSENNMKDFYDCGIIYVNDSRFFYCVMTTRIDYENASNVVGTIVNKVYNFMKPEEWKLMNSA